MNNHPTKADVQALLQDYSVEVTPRSARDIGDFNLWLKPGTQVYVTFLPGTSVEETINTAAILKQQGMRPVPHLALRSIESEAQLRKVLGRLNDLAIKDLLLIAGAVSHPKGPYYSVQKLLQDGLLEAYDFTGIAFAGHPEGSPDIAPDDLRYAESFKQRYALSHPRKYWFVTQFCFAVEPIVAWQQQLFERNMMLPLRVGVAGLATVATLVKHAKACGIGPSMSYLLKNSRGIRHLMSTSAPDELITQLASYAAAQPDSRIDGLHFYPLGGFARTMEWIHAVEAGRFEWKKEGFHVY